MRQYLVEAVLYFNRAIPNRPDMMQILSWVQDSLLCVYAHDRYAFWGYDLYSIHIGVPLQFGNEMQPFANNDVWSTPVLESCWDHTVPNNSILKGISLLVGCVHTFMNQLRAIGMLMPGTWPKDTLEAVHGQNAVVHMLTGRLFRDYLLVDKCLDHVIVSDVVHDSPFWNIGKLVSGNLHVIGGRWYNFRKHWRHLIYIQ